jgi:multicomponent Na+:H+ antiporter subunit E
MQRMPPTLRRGGPGWAAQQIVRELLGCGNPISVWRSSSPSSGSCSPVSGPIPIIVPLGAVSVVLSVWLSRRLGIVDRLEHPLSRLAAALRYWPWLLIQILRSSTQVARHVLSPTLNIKPRIVRLPMTQQTDLGRATLANSITLTPGTTSIHVRQNEIWFYALDEDSALDTLSGEMDRRVRQFEGGKP